MIIECRSKFIEKTITDCYGRQFRALFLVSLVNGEVKGRLISFQPISKEVAAITGTRTDTDCGSYLPASTTKKGTDTPYIAAFSSVVSPYFSALEIFLSTQLTRAPARV
ncbi:MAG: hypothetical protein NT077_02090 [Candidatus Taylorbacteria bacterium]|nr:hypothetical protein [Candidatus Taylorbacteria bacterium]